MEIQFSTQAWNEFAYWLETDPKIASKIKELLNSIVRTPFKGVGKPEPLKNELKGYWSRRITAEHRLVYSISGHKDIDQKCIVVQCRYHYRTK